MNYGALKRLKHKKNTESEVRRQTHQQKTNRQNVNRHLLFCRSSNRQDLDVPSAPPDSSWRRPRTVTVH